MGQRIGNIRVTRLLAEGGMGEVYVGFDDKLHRQVALKSIRAEHRMSREARARFLREARILSQLQHPKVCAVYDYVEGEEQDFLVLELVEGESLRTVMERTPSEHQKMAIATQLLEVLAAVHAAGVVHRDLKPDNVMIMPSGAIKVLDFGLARSLDDDIMTQPVALGRVGDEDGNGAGNGRMQLGEGGLKSAYVKTKLGSIVGTIGYMSPEQAHGEAATTMSDMYSLGLILQEMFTGRPPFAKTSNVRELLVRTLEGETAPVTGVSPALRTLIERMKSLAPGSRPSSVDALAQLRRIIEAPARRRKRRAVAAVWALLLLLAGGMGLQTLRLQHKAAAERQARHEAEEVTGFMTELFELADPGETFGRRVTAAELLDRGAARIGEGLAGQPLVRFRLLRAMGSAYSGLGLYQRAGALLEQALSTDEQIIAPFWVERTAALNELGEAYRLLGRMEEAEATFARALELSSEHPDAADDAASAETVNNLGLLYEDQGRYEEAEALIRQALAQLEAVHGPRDRTMATVLNNLGTLSERLGRPEESEDYYRRALKIFEDELGPQHPDVAMALNNLALAYQRSGRLAEAEPMFGRARDIWEASFGRDHPNVAASLSNLASLYTTQQRFAEAEPLLEEALAISERQLGADHPSTAKWCFNLAQVRKKQGRLEAALPMLERALRTLEAALGADHPNVAYPLLALADVYRLQGSYERARSLYRRAIRIREAALPPGHRLTVAALEEYATALRAAGATPELAAIEARLRALGEAESGGEAG